MFLVSFGLMKTRPFVGIMFESFLGFWKANPSRSEENGFSPKAQNCSFWLRNCSSIYHLKPRLVHLQRKEVRSLQGAVSSTYTSVKDTRRPRRTPLPRSY